MLVSRSLLKSIVIFKTFRWPFFRLLQKCTNHWRKEVRQTCNKWFLHILDIFFAINKKIYKCEQISIMTSHNNCILLVFIYYLALLYLLFYVVMINHVLHLRAVLEKSWNVQIEIQIILRSIITLTLKIMINKTNDKYFCVVFDRLLDVIMYLICSTCILWCE